MFRHTLLVVLGFCSVCCVGTLDETKGRIAVGAPANASTPDRCRSLSDGQALWGSVGAGAAVLSGASGLSTLASDDKSARLALGITSLTVGAVGAGSVFLSQARATAWSAECAK